MDLLNGIKKEDYNNYVLYYIENISDELKKEIRTRLVAICHGRSQAKSTSKIYSYTATAKEFIRRYKTDKNQSEDRKKGMIGELLIHIILELEGRFSAISPFFNMEERSFRKGYDVALFEASAKTIWITEIKSGEKQKDQKNASSAIVGLINTAKNDLKTRLNSENESLWLNALNAAKVSMDNAKQQKDAVIRLLEACADLAVEGKDSSKHHRVVLSGVLFHTMVERMESRKIKQKYNRIIKEDLFKQFLVIAVQEETFEAIYDFLESEAK